MGLDDAAVVGPEHQPRVACGALRRDLGANDAPVDGRLTAIEAVSEVPPESLSEQGEPAIGRPRGVVTNGDGKARRLPPRAKLRQSAM